MRIMLLAAFLAAALGAASAQTLPDKPEPQRPPPRHHHVFGIVPTYDVASIHEKFEPISAKRKFTLFTETTFDRFTLVVAGLQAGVGQATDTPHGYGQGGEGFAKRFGAGVADKITSDFFKIYAYPALFRQDPRYFAMTSANGASGGRRIGYAMSRVFVARGNNGRWQPNISRLLGDATGAAAVNLWYPPEDRHVDDTLVRFATKIGFDMASDIIKEFWKEVSGKMKKK